MYTKEFNIPVVVGDKVYCAEASTIIEKEVTEVNAEFNEYYAGTNPCSKFSGHYKLSGRDSRYPFSHIGLYHFLSKEELIKSLVSQL
jgi:hypothetical protein